MVQTGTDSACTRVRPDDGGEAADDDADSATAFSGGPSISDEGWTAPSQHFN